MSGPADDTNPHGSGDGSGGEADADVSAGSAALSVDEFEEAETGPEEQAEAAAHGSFDQVTDDPADQAVDPPTGEPGAEPVLQMRQVAGLTSGSVMELHVGSFQFHESESDVGFAIVVDETEEAVVVPGTAEARIDEVLLTEASPLHDAVLNVGSACFTVRHHRPDPDVETRLAALEETRKGAGAIVVPDLSVSDGSPTQNRGTRFGALFSRSEEEAETLDRRWWDFLESVREGRSVVAERHRRLHPDPEELKSRVDRLDPGLWDRTRNHPLFGRIGLAYATIPWEPRFDDPGRIPTELHDLIREMSHLPWVPVTANLTHGPLGIAGPRAAALAATRHAVLSLASLTAPSDLSFSIVTAKGLIDSWSWTSALPNSLFTDSRPIAFPIAIADGMVHFDGAGLAHESVLSNEMGLIALAESAEELPDYCATILHISPDGRCVVSNHLGEQVAGTPIGVTADFASSLAASLTAAIGDEDVPAPARPAAPPPQRPPRRPRPEPRTVDQPDQDGGSNGSDRTDRAADADADADEDMVGDANDDASFDGDLHDGDLDDVGDLDDGAGDGIEGGEQDGEASNDIEADDFAAELSQLFSPGSDS